MMLCSVFTEQGDKSRKKTAATDWSNSDPAYMLQISRIPITQWQNRHRPPQKHITGSQLHPN